MQIYINFLTFTTQFHYYRKKLFRKAPQSTYFWCLTIKVLMLRHQIFDASTSTFWYSAIKYLMPRHQKFDETQKVSIKITHWKSAVCKNTNYFFFPPNINSVFRCVRILESSNYSLSETYGIIKEFPHILYWCWN